MEKSGNLIMSAIAVMIVLYFIVRCLSSGGMFILGAAALACPAWFFWKARKADAE